LADFEGSKGSEPGPSVVSYENGRGQWSSSLIGKETN